MREDELQALFLQEDSYCAHINPKTGEKQNIKTHLHNVAYLAQKNCPLEILKTMCLMSAVTHDAGKLSSQFQNYMKEIERYGDECVRHYVDHVTAGGRILEDMAKGKLVAKMTSIAVYSHHGLQDCVDMDTGELLAEEKRQKVIEYPLVWERYFNIVNKQELFQHMKMAHSDLLKIKELVRSATETYTGCGNKAFYLRMYERLILSVLIDSDWSDSASFSEGTLLPERNDDETMQYIWKNAIYHFESYMEAFCESKEKSLLDIQRQNISDLCYRAAQTPNSLYRLTVPTGAGKTFSSMRFALHHALKYHKNHIFYVAPYNSILEQNAQDIRNAIGNGEYVLEHHCNVLPESEVEEIRYRNLTESWDCPVIVTTAVQMLNVLFSGSKSCIRRMYNLCNSVIIFDEVQAFPVKCTELFHLAVNFLTYFCNTTVALCSATQPTVSKLAENNLFQCMEMAGDMKLYMRDFKRVVIEDKTDLVPGGMALDDIGSFVRDKAERYQSVLLIVNTKQAALEIYQEIEKINDKQEVYHLSTNMCAEHRNEVIAQIKESLSGKKRVICISTPLIEAGVNISFGCVIRSLAGLDSIIQAAGRCNRHKELKEFGKLYIIKLCKELEMLEGIVEVKKAKQATERLLGEFRNNPQVFDNTLDSQTAIKRYYDLYYHEFDNNETKYPAILENTHVQTNLVDLLGQNTIGINLHTGKYNQGIKLPLNQAFKTAGNQFEVISEQGKISVVIAYNQTVRDMIKELENIRLPLLRQKQYLRKLQRYTVGISENMKQKLEYAITELGETGILILNMDYYDDNVGVVTEWNGKFLNF